MKLKARISGQAVNTLAKLGKPPQVLAAKTRMQRVVVPKAPEATEAVIDRYTVSVQFTYSSILSDRLATQ